MLPSKQVIIPEDRKLTEEANVIKQALTRPDPHPEYKEALAIKVGISFTTLSQSVIPGLSLTKILGTRLTVTYVPDFFYITELCQRLFLSARNDRSLAKHESCNIQAFTLYVVHALFYIYVKTVHEVNHCDHNLSNLLKVYESSGFNSIELPSICSSWIDALGRHLPADLKRQFMPKFPDLGPDAVNNSGFFSANTAHLLPNFFSLLSIIRISADQSTTMSILPPHIRSKNGILGSPSNHPVIQNSTFCRSYAPRIPGCYNLASMHSDSELTFIVQDALARNYTDPMQNIAKVTPQLLLHLKTAMQPLFAQIETVKLNDINPTGTALVMLPLINEADQEVFRTAVNVAAVAANPVTPALTIHSEHDHKSRVKSRVEIINGYVDVVYQTPIVRIPSLNDIIPFEDIRYVDPQHPWYLQEHEFQTAPLTLTEARSYFKRMN